MANQITIDIGAAANDGTGDPLRTAFNYVNNNFSNVWNTGLPNSNVQFSDNRILTVNTNANLVLAPNGIGKVASNVDIVPNTANVFNLGSATRRWNTVYGQYLNLSHNATIGGNLVVTGNITGGNINYTGNVFIGDLEGSVFDGASSVVLDVLTSSIYVDNYYYANGAPFSGGSGNYGNANVAAYLPTYTGNISANNISAGNVFTAQNITATDAYINTGSFAGDDITGDAALYVGAGTFTNLGTDVMAQFTGNVTNYGQINFQNYSNSPTASGDYIATADNGNDTTYYIDMGITSSTWDGTQTNVLTGLAPNNGYLYVQDGNLTLGTRNGNTSYTWNFDTAGNLTVAGNVIPTGNNTQSLGSPTRQWNDLYLSNATIYMNSVPLSVTAGNILTVNGADVVTTAANGESNIGNLDILGTTISITNGAPQTYINLSASVEGWAYVQVPTDATANVYNTRIHNDAGNIEFGSGDASNAGPNYTWTLDNTGNLNLPNNGDINFSGGGLQQVVNEDFYIRASDNESDGWSIYNVVDDGAGNTLSQTRLEYNQYTVRTNAQGAAYTWAFRDTGVLDLPGDIYGNVGGNLTIKIGDQAGSNTFIDLQTRSYVGDALISNIRIANPNVTISTASGAQNWTFGSTGTLTLPNSANIVSANDITIINSTTTANGIIGINARESTFGESVAQIYLDSNDRVARVSTYNPNTEIGYDWTFDAGGSFTLPTAPGNIYMGTNTNGPFILPTSLGITFNANRADETQDYIQVSQDGVNIFSVNTINIENNTTGFLNTDINLRSGDDILLQGRNKPNDSESEGGDINIYAGAGASAVTEGFDTGGGGDIQLAAGAGGEDTGGGFGGGGGGTMNISAGDGGVGNATTNAGGGGSLSLTAGSAAGTANTALGGIGGSISINAGDTTRINEIGGTISLNTGSASGDGTGAAGYVEINIPSSNIGTGGTWTFGGTGTTLNVPGNAEIYGANFGNLTVGCAGNTIVTSSVYGSGNVKNWVFGSTGDLTLPDGGNINAGTANANVALNAFSSAGNTVSIQAQGNSSSAVISIFSNAGPVTSNWTFTTAPLDPSESFLYIPNGGAITTPNATGGEGGKNIFIQAGASDPVTWNSNPGGELMLKGGYGSFGDGGGGPGGDVNIEGGASSDSHAGNVNISSGLNTWVFDYTGNIQGNISLTGPSITINNAPGGTEGAEVTWALPNVANTVLSGSVAQDVYANGMRFFETGGNTRGLTMDLGNVPNGTATAVGYRDIPQISLGANVTADATNAGRHFYSTTAGNLQITLPDNANVAFPLGATLTVVVNAAGNVVVAQGTGVSLYMAGSSTTGNRTVGAYGLASVMKVATDTWVISGTGVY